MDTETIETVEPKRETKQKEMKKYTREEAIESSLKYFDGDTIAADVWVNKYALKDSFGNIYELNPDDMHHRLAKEFSRAESKFVNPIPENEIYELLKGFKYIVPQGSPMAGMGNDFQIVSLSNCYVIGNDNEADSYGGIMKLDEELVQLMKRRAGVGTDLSFIRPKGSPVKNTALTSTGVVPFMERFSNSTREVAQDGRRGALMLSISINSMDSEAFIDAKTEQNKVTGANVSVRITDEFMNAVVNNEKYIQKYPVDSKKPKFTKEINAKTLWNKIIHNAWKSAEPGLLYWDTIIRESVPDCYSDMGFKTTSTNPCSELNLCNHDSCRLLLVNLYSYVDNPFTPEAKFNFVKFRKHTRIAQRFMDDLVELELEKIDKILSKIESDPEDENIKSVEIDLWKQIKHKCIQGRRTGLGITAEGDMIAALGLIYGTDAGNDFVEEVHKELKLAAYESSVEMAKERGAFPIYDSQKEKNNPFINRIKKESPKLYNDMIEYGRRNIALLTIAPAGSVSIMTQTTSGIEPVFMVSYTRRRKINPNDKNTRVDFTDSMGDCWQEYPVFHHKFIDYLKINNYDVNEVMNMKKEDIDKIIEKSPYYKATSNDVNWVKKVEMQGKVQKHIDHSISVTTNLPNDVSEEMVSKIYETGWRAGCKGMTIYRDGSRSGVLISDSDKKEKEKEKMFMDINAPKRPKFLDAEVHRFINKGERWIAFVGILDGRPYEIFTGQEDGFDIPKNIDKGVIRRMKIDGKSRYDFIINHKTDDVMIIEGLSTAFNVDYHNYAKMISSILRHGMPLAYVVNLIESLNLGEDSLSTWKSGVVRSIKKYIKDGTKAKSGICSNCGAEDSMVFQEGCFKCLNCLSSKCS